MEKLDLKQTCEMLSISVATAKNWLRLGKIISDDGGKTFSKQYVYELAENIKSGKDNRLKSRRNKKGISGNEIYKDYIENIDNQNSINNIVLQSHNFTQDEQRILIANYAYNLYQQSQNIFDNKFLVDFNDDSIDNLFRGLLYDFIKDITIKELDVEKIEKVFDNKLKFDRTDDTLGCLYISLKDKGSRKKFGTYYTPKKVVDLLLDSVFKNDDDSDGKTYCDPCCGTGNFLIGLINRGVNIKNIYGYDIDEISIKLTRMTLFLLDNKISSDVLYKNIICDDVLVNQSDRLFSVILGNPPWGYEFSNDEIEKILKIYKTAKMKGLESFNLFIEKAFNLVEENGNIAYILPESILTVASHKKVRKLIIEKSSFDFISYIGNVFFGVNCPAIILGLKHDDLGSTKDCSVNLKGEKFVISENRIISENSLFLNMTDDEYSCMTFINSLENCCYLKGKADFAIGIVTGNNKKYIINEEKVGYETVLRGSDVIRYGFKEVDRYIKFEPALYQQVAPVEIYRAKEKLLYRFICEIPVFSYDDKQKLSLNSCNVLIPKIENIHIKYILAILNSSVAAYYIANKFNSVKLLRSHLEALPIPIIDIESQDKIISKVDLLMKIEDKFEVYHELDAMIMDIYMLSEKQRAVIHNFMSKKKLFLQ